MAHPLSEFLQAATSDTIRCTNTFEIECSSGYSDVDSVIQKVTLFGQNINIPARGIEYAPVSFKGYEIPNLVPTRLTMETEHSMNVIADINGEHRRLFLRWMNHVMNADIEGGSLFEGMRGVNEKSIIRIRLFDKMNKDIVETYRFYNVAITNVGNITLDYNGGEAAKFEVGFKSSFWQLENPKEGAFKDQR